MQAQFPFRERSRQELVFYESGQLYKAIKHDEVEWRSESNRGFGEDRTIRATQNGTALTVPTEAERRNWNENQKWLAELGISRSAFDNRLEAA
jgi:hypothetical protein